MSLPAGAVLDYVASVLRDALALTQCTSSYNAELQPSDASGHGFLKKMPIDIFPAVRLISMAEFTLVAH
jgi:hypothetical protein